MPLLVTTWHPHQHDAYKNVFLLVFLSFCFCYSFATVTQEVSALCDIQTNFVPSSWVGVTICGQSSPCTNSPSGVTCDTNSHVTTL